MSRKIIDKILKLRTKAEDLESQAEFVQQQADNARARAEKSYKESEKFSKQANDLWEKYIDCDDTEKANKLYVDHLVAQAYAEAAEKTSEQQEKEADKLDDKAQNLKFKAMDIRYEIENLRSQQNDERERKQREKKFADFNAFMERENERIRQRAFGDTVIKADNVNTSAQVTPKPAEPVKPAEPPERKHLPVLAYDFKKNTADQPKPYDGSFGDVDPGLAALYNDERAGYEENTYIFRENYGNKKRPNKHDMDDDFNFDD